MSKSLHTGQPLDIRVGNIDVHRHYYCVAESSIEHLPSEVLLQVFQWLVAEEPLPVPWLFTEAPLTILHVCSTWRHLALHDGEFWRHMLITLNSNNPNFSTMFQLTLLRSNSKQLSIELEGNKVPIWMAVFTDLVIPEFHRTSAFGARWRSSLIPGHASQIPQVIRSFYHST
jgi:hypothetical protein